ncbi:hypothetical protein LINGRAHAP2_LOCUS29563 [Linum grandiflorum]
MAPRKRNQESDLPQPFVEEEQVAAGDAGVGSSNNLVREEVPPQSAPTADLGGAVASLLQMMEGNRKLMEENRQLLEGRLDGLGQNHQHMSVPSAVGHSSQPRQENFSSPVNNQPSPHRANRGDIPATTHVEGLNDVGMGELPPRGGNPSPTFNIPVDQSPMHGAGQPPPIPMARPYVAPANMGGGVGLSGGDHIPPRAYPRPMPPQFNGQGMDPMGFMPPGGQQGGHGHDANALREQVAQLLNEQFGLGVRTTMPPVYRKPYPEWVDRHYPFPRGFRVPDFATFTGIGDQSTVEHIGRFTVQCGDVGDFVKLRIFGNSLTGAAFAWYVNLPSNYIQTWQQMEQTFHAQFYRSEPEVSMADLARMRQQPGESVEHFLTNFKNARNRCFVNLTEREFVKLAQGGLAFELRKKFEDREFADLFQLMSCAVRYEPLLHEEECLKGTLLSPSRLPC